MASRRASERLILEGKVVVNGKRVSELGVKIDPGHDRVLVEGVPIQAQRKLYVALNKPPGFICSRSDPEKREIVGNLLPKEWGQLVTVGRLDRESEGLIFLTNDGEFTLKLTHPRYGVRKQYRVIVKGRLEEAQLRRLKEGIEEGGEVLRASATRLISANGTQSVAEVELTQGHNREIRRLFESCGREVLRLQRFQIGPIKLGELPMGRWRVLTPIEVKSLLRPSA